MGLVSKMIIGIRSLMTMLLSAREYKEKKKKVGKLPQGWDNSHVVLGKTPTLVR